MPRVRCALWCDLCMVVTNDRNLQFYFNVFLIEALIWLSPVEELIVSVLHGCNLCWLVYWTRCCCHVLLTRAIHINLTSSCNQLRFILKWFLFQFKLEIQFRLFSKFFGNVKILNFLKGVENNLFIVTNDLKQNHNDDWNFLFLNIHI